MTTPTKTPIMIANGIWINVNTFKLPIENSQRALINIKKVRKTEAKYPRSIDKIKKSL